MDRAKLCLRNDGREANRGRNQELGILYQSHRNKIRSSAGDYAATGRVAPAATSTSTTTAAPATHVAAACGTDNDGVDIVKVSLVLDVLKEKLHIANHGDCATPRLHRSVIDWNRDQGTALRYRLAICREWISGSCCQRARPVGAADRIHSTTAIGITALATIRDEIAHCAVIRSDFEAV